VHSRQSEALIDDEDAFSLPWGKRSVRVTGENHGIRVSPTASPASAGPRRRRHRLRTSWSIADAAMWERPDRALVLNVGARNVERLYVIPALCRLARCRNATIIPVISEAQPTSPPVRTGMPTNYMPKLTARDVIFTSGPRPPWSRLLPNWPTLLAPPVMPIHSSRQAQQRSGGVWCRAPSLGSTARRRLPRSARAREAQTSAAGRWSRRHNGQMLRAALHLRCPVWRAATVRHEGRAMPPGPALSTHQLKSGPLRLYVTARIAHDRSRAGLTTRPFAR
jgi:hypothetical protein